MKSKFKINQTVWLLDSKKTDGRYNKGKVVGIEFSYPYLSFLTEREYLAAFCNPVYKVAFVDCFTGRGNTEWSGEANLQKEKPEDAK